MHCFFFFMSIINQSAHLKFPFCSSRAKISQLKRRTKELEDSLAAAQTNSSGSNINNNSGNSSSSNNNNTNSTNAATASPSLSGVAPTPTSASSSSTLTVPAATAAVSSSSSALGQFSSLSSATGFHASPSMSSLTAPSPPATMQRVSQSEDDGALIVFFFSVSLIAVCCLCYFFK